ncbi:biotin-independent malonate decarboxylase subunit gamma [Martelella alba]|uniref:Biotin-independent malonate decarboxylase subunit gamma n=1 Tax=Martelella alba TaxID=2590451 RepID=A0ABY2SJX1_9HYPH|nr:biotin-independent malonate decarboxylase subunit gamma [Martelella alba]TKI05029.1 biotin-independent malonate decarboxylase subunit gamma [Martelella alba]
MNTPYLSRGDYWFSLLTKDATLCQGQCPSVKVADGRLDGRPARYIAVVPDADNRYPRAARGEVGLLEGWTLDEVVSEAVAEDRDRDDKRAIVAIVDVPSQAYGRREEAFGIHQSLAGAASAYAGARLAGHPVIALIVGKAMSGAFLAHGYQANQLIAFNDPAVMIHAMGKDSAARITLRSVDALEQLAKTIPPMAYDIENYATLGLLAQLLDIANPDRAGDDDIDRVTRALSQAQEQCRRQGTTLAGRLGAANRQSSQLVRERMRREW